MRILKIFKETISDGPGFRYSIYFSGCSHGCLGCHNTDSWDSEQGSFLDDEYFKKIITEIKANKMLSGITLSGGDPFYDPKELLDFLIKIKKELEDINIWCYTGYTIEQLIDNELMRESLKYLDILVDGRFIQELYQPDLDFRGSSNQRIIDIKEYLKNNNLNL